MGRSCLRTVEANAYSSQQRKEVVWGEPTGEWRVAWCLQQELRPRLSDKQRKRMFA